MNAVPELSVVIPFYNEAENVPALLAELRQALTALGSGHEVIAVDDGSRDDTGRALDTLAVIWPDLRVIKHPENRGQAAALLTGFAATRAPWIATLDGDGQNPPAELARLWARRDEADFLTGYRATREDSPLRRGMSRVANAVRRRLLRDGVRDTGCAVRVFRREVIGSFIPIRTLYSFLPAFAAADGWRVLEIPVAHRPRQAGQSKYGLLVMAWRPFVDMIKLWWVLRRKVPRARRPAGT